MHIRWNRTIVCMSVCAAGHDVLDHWRGMRSGQSCGSPKESKNGEDGSELHDCDMRGIGWYREISSLSYSFTT